MKAYLQKLCNDAESLLIARHLVREYLQARILQRAYPKGRDIYDLSWYLSQPDWPEPNLIQLNEALAQSGWTGPVLDSSNWRSIVQERIEQLDWQEDVLRDIQAFIITTDWEQRLNKDALISLLIS